MSASTAHFDAIVAKFDRVKTNGTGMMAECPAHEDRKQSLHISLGKNGSVVLKCHAGCETDRILAAKGLNFKDLWPKEESAKAAPTVTSIQAYDYRDRDGVTLVCQSVRKNFSDGTKAFFQRRPQPGGGWINNMQGVDPPLYRIAELLAADPDEIRLILEGEKDVDRAIREGFNATTNIGGAGKWQDRYSDGLAGLHLAIVADNDLAGYKHALMVYRSVERKAESVALVQLTVVPPKGDLSDLFDAGVRADDFEPLVCGVVSKILGAELITVEQIEAIIAGLEEEAEGKKRAAPPSPGGSAPHGEQPQDQLSDGPTINPSDLGNARRLVRDHGEDIHYCTRFAKWYEWRDGYWRDDETDEIVRLAKATVGTIYSDAANTTDESERKALAKHALKSEGEQRIHAMIGLAESEPGIPIRPDELDCDPWLLTVKNGTLDLRTGKLGPHRREDLITKRAPVTFDPDASCIRWTAFLESIFAGDADLIRFVKRALGYSLSGSTRERVLFILHGVGRNGKGTMLEVVRAILGPDYSSDTPTDTLLVKRDSGIPNDIAKLRGARFVTASEVDEGRRLAEATVKKLTGGDMVSARFMRGEFFDFMPAFKLWLGTNHKPDIRGTDRAIWDRLRTIPFGVRFVKPDEEPDAPVELHADPLLREKLLEEAPGILAWMVQGCLEWQRDGLGYPKAVKDATAGYRAEMDILGNFISDCCVVSESAHATAKDLYGAYNRWCESTGEKPMTQTMVGKRLTERGFDSAQVGKVRARTWIGIGIRSEEE